MNSIEIGDWYRIVPSDSVVHWQTCASSADQVFGHVSYVSHVAQGVAYDGRETIGWQGSTVIIILLALYCYMLFRHHREIRVSLKAAFSLDDTLFVFENLTLEFSRFLRLVRLLLVMSVAVMLCSLGNQLTLVAFAISAFVVWLVVNLSSLFRGIVSRFDYQIDRWVSIGSVTRLNLSIIALIFCPVVVLVMIFGIYAVVSLSALIVLWIYHWGRLFRFFTLSGFSNVQWFLYLCAVEIIPFSLIVGIARFADVLN